MNILYICVEKIAQTFLSQNSGGMPQIVMSNHFCFAETSSITLSHSCFEHFATRVAHLFLKLVLLVMYNK